MYKYHLNKFFWGQTKKYGDVSLRQIGLMHCNPGSTIPSHIQGNHYEITAVIDGEGTVFVNAKKERLERGCIHLVCPLDAHSIKSSKDNPLKFLFFSFTHDDPAITTELQIIHENLKTSPTHIVRENSIISQLELAITEINQQPDLFHDQYTYAILQQVVLAVIRAFNKTQDKKVKVSKKEEFCYQIMAYINSHITEISSLSELSNIFNYEYSYISRTFKSTVKQSLSEYYHVIRLQTAKGYLDDNYSCTEIADLLKYASVYSFSKAFKDLYKISPTEYKKQQNRSFYKDE